MSDPLYDQIRSKDVAIAEKFREFTKGNPRAKINPTQMLAITEVPFQDGKFTDDEMMALIYITSSDRIDDFTRLVFVQAIKDRLQTGILGTTPVTGAGLDPFRRALSIDIVGKIHFDGPYTKATYSPPKYLAVLSLIEKKAITVVRVNLGRFKNTTQYDDGRYNATHNQVKLFAELTTLDEVAMVVHEATHAIQDWEDKSALIKNSEAEAFVAGAIVDYGFRRKASEFIRGTPRRVAFDVIGTMLKNSTPLAGEPLKRAVDKIAGAVQVSPDYADVANFPSDTTSGTTKDEPGEFLKAINKVTANMKVAGSIAKGILDALEHLARELHN